MLLSLVLSLLLAGSGICSECQDSGMCVRVCDCGFVVDICLGEFKYICM